MKQLLKIELTGSALLRYNSINNNKQAGYFGVKTAGYYLYIINSGDGDGMDIRDLIEQEILPKIRQPLWESWYIKEKIGSGSFSVVYRIEAQRPGGTDESALKVEAIASDGQLFSDDIHKSTFLNDKRQMAVNEAQIMKKLRDCPYIVRYEEEHMQELYVDGAFEGYYYLIRMELLENVYEMMRQKTFDFSEKNVRKLAAEIGQGLKAAHEIGIIHRDIKPENMFMSKKGIYKLGDFNISKKAATTRTYAGSRPYMAPEIYWSKAAPESTYTTQADLYSFGLCLYQMMNNGVLPFEDQFDPDTAFDKRMNGDPYPPPQNASTAFARVIMEACAFDYNARYRSADDLLLALQSLPEIRSERTGSETVYADAQGDNTAYADQTEYADTPRRASVNEEYAAGHGNYAAAKPKNAGYSKVIVCLIIILLLLVGMILLALKWNADNKGHTGEAESSQESSQADTVPAAEPAEESTDIPAALPETTPAPFPQTIPPETAPPAATAPPETIPAAETAPPETALPVQSAGLPITNTRSIVATVRSSSQLGDINANGKRHTYNVWNVLDGDLSTCWAEGKEGLGENEKIQLIFNDTYRVSRVTIYNGLETSRELYEKNARVGTLDVSFSNGASYEFSLNDGWESAVSTFTLPAPVDTSYIELTVKSAYAGSRYEDTCISEIELG